MMKKVKRFSVLICGLCLLFSSCGTQNITSQHFKVHDDGRKKAVTCITPIYDLNNILLPWSLSEDLTNSLKTRLVKRGNIYLTNLSIEEIDMEENSFDQLKTNYLEENLTLNFNNQNLKERYPDSEFVVFMELTKHDIHAKLEQKTFLDKITPSYALDMAIRLRIVDLRSNTPTLILHEIVEQTHLLPKQFSKIDTENPMWGKKTYGISPLGFAHFALIKEVASRIENYLILAKTQ